MSCHLGRACALTQKVFRGSSCVAGNWPEWSPSNPDCLLAVTQATNFNAFAGFGTQRPNRVANPELPSDERSTAQFFNTAAFLVAPQFTLGSSSRNPVRGPNYQNVDFALIKRTYVREQMNVEFRAETFNLTNTPPLNAPNVVLGTPGFGSITSAGDPRVIQFALKFNF